MTRLFLKYVTFVDPRHAFVCALWCAQTWLFRTETMHGIRSVGYLAFTSPAPDCGKTDALTVLSALSYGHPSTAVNSNPAPLYHKITKTRATIILDELDRLKEDSDIIAILNAGYKKDATVERMGGRDKDQLMTYQVFGPKAVGYIRDSNSLRSLPRTFESRCIRILLNKRTKKEQENAPELIGDELKREAAPLVDYLTAFSMAPPHNYPEEVFPHIAEAVKPWSGREREIWRNLLGIAWLAGRLDDAVDAAINVLDPNRDDAEDHNSDIPILRDIQSNLHDLCDEDGFSTKVAAKWLNSLPDRTYNKWGRAGEGLTHNLLGRILSKYGLRGKKVGPRRRSRISRTRLEDVLARHLPGDGEPAEED